MSGEHLRQSQELGQEVHRSMTLRERLEYELAELEASLVRMRDTVRELPPDQHPGPSDPVALPDEGGATR